MNAAQQIKITEILDFHAQKIINNFWMDNARTPIGWNIQISTNETIPLTAGYNFSQLRVKVY